MTVKCTFCNDTKQEPGIPGPCVWCEEVEPVTLGTVTRYAESCGEGGGVVEHASGQFVEFKDYDAALAREAALREELDNVRDDLIIFKSAVSALGEASKKLVFYARTSGGTAGPDQGLMDACAGVEGVITLGGIARAMNEFERLTAERDDLAARLEQARDRKNSIVDLQQRLTVSEEFVQKLVDCSIGQDSVATGYLSDILAVLKGENV